ncbi:MAG: OmpH family outer membrane protein [Flavobacteriales bacterium]|nr:OmpH family outer membrane protein [Flavobacteriales bacterium]
MALCLCGGLLCSQTYIARVAVVDMKKITSSLPQYQTAERYIEGREVLWKEKIDSLTAVHDSLKEDFTIQKMLLPQDVAETVSDKIVSIGAQIDSMRIEFFGPNGLYVTEKRRLLEPILQTIRSHINDYAQKNKISVVLDKSEMTVLYVDKFSDISDVILRKMEKDNKKE